MLIQSYIGWKTRFYIYDLKQKVAIVFPSCDLLIDPLLIYRVTTIVPILTNLLSLGSNEGSVKIKVSCRHSRNLEQMTSSIFVHGVQRTKQCWQKKSAKEIQTIQYICKLKRMRQILCLRLYMFFPTVLFLGDLPTLTFNGWVVSFYIWGRIFVVLDLDRKKCLDSTELKLRSISYRAQFPIE